MTKMNQSLTEVHSLMTGSILTAKTSTKVGTWNVRTMFQCGKLAQLCKEFKAYQLDILGISEMRWTGNGKITTDGVTVLYSGHQQNHIHGVGFLLRKEASKSLIGWKPVNDRILITRFQSRHAKVTVIQAYASAEDAEETVKDEFYNQLQETINEIPSYDIKLLMGDMNAQLDNSRQGMKQALGPHGTSRIKNGNDERFFLLCSTNGMSAGNTFFAHKNTHKKTWRAPDGTTKNEIDFICISQRWRSSIQDVRVHRGAGVGSDHYLLKALVKLKLKNIKTSQSKRPFVAEKLKDPLTVNQFQINLTNRFSALQNSNDIEDQ